MKLDSDPPESESPIKFDGVKLQYEQMHAAKLQWERYIWQAPAISTAIIGVTFALAAGENVQPFVGSPVIASGMLMLGLFSMVVGFWGHRSRILLRETEKVLMRIEREHFGESFDKYPSQLNARFSKWLDRQSSTTAMVNFMFATGLILLAFSIFEFSISIRRFIENNNLAFFCL
ncbi:MAG TPA: hypothetical protein DDZ68_11865 [Parvularcula sp.]|nr:hypothetical protein [Parvularcula sp.]